MRLSPIHASAGLSEAPDNGGENRHCRQLVGDFFQQFFAFSSDVRYSRPFCRCNITKSPDIAAIWDDGCPFLPFQALRLHLRGSERPRRSGPLVDGHRDNDNNYYKKNNDNDERIEVGADDVRVASLFATFLH